MSLVSPTPNATTSNLFPHKLHASRRSCTKERATRRSGSSALNDGDCIDDKYPYFNNRLRASDVSDRVVRRCCPNQSTGHRQGDQYHANHRSTLRHLLGWHVCEHGVGSQAEAGDGQLRTVAADGTAELHRDTSDMRYHLLLRRDGWPANRKMASLHDETLWQISESRCGLRPIRTGLGKNFSKTVDKAAGPRLIHAGPADVIELTPPRLCRVERQIKSDHPSAFARQSHDCACVRRAVPPVTQKCLPARARTACATDGVAPGGRSLERQRTQSSRPQRCGAGQQAAPLPADPRHGTPFPTGIRG